MATVRKKLQAHYQHLFDAAKAKVSRNEDGSLPEAQVIEQMAAILIERVDPRPSLGTASRLKKRLTP